MRGEIGSMQLGLTETRGRRFLPRSVRGLGVLSIGEFGLLDQATDAKSGRCWIGPVPPDG